MSSGGGASNGASGGGASNQQRLRLNNKVFSFDDTLFALAGRAGKGRYCNRDELVQVLIEAGFCTPVETFQVQIEKLGASHGRDHLTVEVDNDLSDPMKEVKRVIEAEEGVHPWEAQLYRSEEDWDGTYGSVEQQEAALLTDEYPFDDGPCTLQLVCQEFQPGSKSNITWTQENGDFSAEDDLVSFARSEAGSAVSTETIAFSADTVQGVSWVVGTVRRRCYLGLTTCREVTSLAEFDFALGGSELLLYVENEEFKATELEHRDDTLAVQEGDTLAVTVHGNQVLYTRNGKLVARSLKPPGFPLHAAVLFLGADYDEPQEETMMLGVELERA